MIIELVQVERKYGKELNLTPYNLRFLWSVVTSSEEYDFFLKNYWQPQQGREFFSILNYRQSKLQKRNFTFKNFLQMYEVDKELALEKLFLHPIEGSELLEEKINYRKITLEELYKKHTNEPLKHFLNFIL